MVTHICYYTWIHQARVILRYLPVKKRILLPLLFLLFFAFYRTFLNTKKHVSDAESYKKSLYYQRQIIGRKVQSEEVHSRLFDPSSLIGNYSEGMASLWVNQTIKTG